ncbi:hypothetical protein OG871_34805 [Kitasatospora sp. NBC_00374]|uniref:hypothetical protein n=1 Tax=Kitasatospora sp. NBC_00374 TaxID=2975964 RepID=UPI0032481052
MSENKRTDPAATGRSEPLHDEPPNDEPPNDEPPNGEPLQGRPLPGDGRESAPRRPVASVPRQAEAGERRRPAAVPQQVLPGEPHPGPGTSAGGGWLPTERVERLSAEWHAVQSGFVDDPGRACKEADALVEKAAALVAEVVAEQRRDLRGGGSPADGGAPDTEALRLAMQDYHRLLDRLLAA